MRMPVLLVSLALMRCDSSAFRTAGWLSCLTGACKLRGQGCSYAMSEKQWLLCFAFNFCHQLLDAMDGTMARMYSMTSELGAKLDEFTDIFFGFHLALVQQILRFVTKPTIAILGC
eukprot:SAG31_NODE_333_length_17527_cov_6.972056_10_plen_116_part_00